MRFKLEIAASSRTSQTDIPEDAEMQFEEDLAVSKIKRFKVVIHFALLATPHQWPRQPISRFVIQLNANLFMKARNLNKGS